MLLSTGRAGATATLLASALLATSPAAAAEHPTTTSTSATAFRVRNLVSNGPVAAEHVDRDLVNAWGLAFGKGTPAWVADNGTGKSTIYDGNGNKVPLVVAIPGGAPTGTVFNQTPRFRVTRAHRSGAARFIFASEAGIVTGWSPVVSRTRAVVAFRARDGAVYKGVTLAFSEGKPQLYLADFRNAKIDVLDDAFRLVRAPGEFVDPALHGGFAPFNVRLLDGKLYVTYAKQDSSRTDDVAGPGLGFVDVFNPKGFLLKRLIQRGLLDAPWGLALAPPGFGPLGGDLLVGNFGDGTINAYDPASGAAAGTLIGPGGRRLAIDGLWALSFGNGASTQRFGTLFFTAGPNDEANGLFGRIEPIRGS